MIIDVYKRQGIGLVNTVLAGFIAFSIADKPAIGAGLIGGALASNTKACLLYTS